jgi:hypothetical protein
MVQHYAGDRDSLLVNFLLTQFNTFHYDQSEIEKQLSGLRSGNPNSAYTRSINATFRNFHFQSFRFDSQTHTPFAIEVTDDKDNVLFFFTFTDEVYYNTNSLSARPMLDRLVFDSQSSNDSLLHHNINLETNLNAFIRRLNIERDRNAIRGLIDLIFRKLLEMKPYEDSEIIMIVEQLGGEPKAVDLVRAEYSQFMDNRTEDIFKFKSLEGAFGYWRIWIEEVDGVFTVKTTFFSDVLFTSLYM